MLTANVSACIDEISQGRPLHTHRAVPAMGRSVVALECLGIGRLQVLAARRFHVDYAGAVSVRWAKAAIGAVGRRHGLARIHGS